MTEDLMLVSAANAATLADLHAQAFGTPWSEAALAELLGEPGVIGFGNENGFILCRVVADEAEILTLAVRPPARRSGLGTRLMSAAATWAAGCGARRLFLEVAEDNHGARGLYDANGFIQVGRRKGYYARASTESVAALVLARDLSST